MPPIATTAITLAELADRVGAPTVTRVVVRCVGTLEHADPDAIAFLESAPRPLPPIRARGGDRHAGRQLQPLPKLLHANPYATYAKVANILHAQPAAAAGIDATARVGEGARVDPTAAIGPFAIIGARTTIGARAVLGAGVSIGDDATIGDDAHLHPRVTVYARCAIGARSIVHAGAVIGADGFGMAEENGRWLNLS
jgi:UDP-3-O-[3-hydroxymyristoyl] glucosamine N-acyltransferase